MSLTAETDIPMLDALVPQAPRTRLTIEQSVTAIREEVAIRVYAQPAQTAHVPAPAAVSNTWTPEQLRDYVVVEIEKVVGVFPRKPEYKEMAIFKGFCSRYGERAAEIARHAFEVEGGYWRSAPISVTRFCANSDPYFADPILAIIDAAKRSRAARA